jgi:hypothetical protein
VALCSLLKTSPSLHGWINSRVASSGALTIAMLKKRGEKMKLYTVKLTYKTCTVNCGGYRLKKTARRLMQRLLNDFCYSGSIHSEIEARDVSLKDWLTGQP